MGGTAARHRNKKQVSPKNEFLSGREWCVFMLSSQKKDVYKLVSAFEVEEALWSRGRCLCLARDRAWVGGLRGIVIRSR